MTEAITLPAPPDLLPRRFADLGGIQYLSGSSNPSVVVAAATQPRLGMLAQPGNAYHRHGRSFARWGVDNGAFGKAMRGTPWTDTDTEIYLDYLAKVARESDVSNVLFATAPDVLTFIDGGPRGDAAATWARGVDIFPRIRQLGMPVALVAQDGILGISPQGADWDAFDVLFLGGSDQFKLGPEGAAATKRAKARGKWVHMGRVNSLKRLRYAASIGCDSADGTFIGFGPSKNLPLVLQWLAKTAAPLGRAA